MKYSLRIRSGFTLVEVVLAGTILMFGFGGMVEALMIGSEMLDTASKQTIAAQIMQAEIDYLRLKDWTTITSSPDPDYLANYPEFASSNLAALAGQSFKFTRTISYVPDHSNQILQVKMTVAWISITGKLSSESWLNLHYDPISEAWTSTSSKLHLRSCNAYIGKYGLNVSYQKS